MDNEIMIKLKTAYDRHDNRLDQQTPVYFKKNNDLSVK